MSGAPALQSARLPLAVDMDGTLLRVDTLYEGFAGALMTSPLKAIAALGALAGGIAAFKRRVREIAPLDAETLPLRDDLVEWLEGEKAAGRRLVLATAADRAVAEGVAARTGLFDAVYASDGETNLKSSAKAEALATAFPEGFVYAGDSAADLAVWKRSAGAVVVASDKSFEAKAREAAPVVERIFPKPGVDARIWLKAMRPHQWAKNAIVLVPVALGWNQLGLAGAAPAIPAMALLCVLASLTYFVNDIADLSSDRRHWSKRRRAFASGALPVHYGLIAAAIGIPAILALGYLIAPAVSLCLAAYLTTTLAYSFGLKRAAFLDTFLIGGLFTLRLVLGAVATGLAGSAWLYAFSMFFFFSLATAKRHAELLRAQAKGREGALPGRGYWVEDCSVTLIFGIAAAMASCVILVIYLVEEVFKQGVYGNPHWLWAAPGVIFLWVARVWLLAHRGQMTDDPVVFALRDRISLGLGLLLAISLVLALL